MLTGNTCVHVILQFRYYSYYFSFASIFCGLLSSVSCEMLQMANSLHVPLQKTILKALLHWLRTMKIIILFSMKIPSASPGNDSFFPFFFHSKFYFINKIHFSHIHSTQTHPHTHALAQTCFIASYCVLRWLLLSSYL